MQSSISLRLFVLIGSALLLAVTVNAELSPFFNFRETHSDSEALDLRSRSRQLTNDSVNLRSSQLRQRELNGQYGAARGKHAGHYTTGRYGEKIYYAEYDCENFYGKSHKYDKKEKKSKLEKYDKQGKKCKGVTPKPNPGNVGVVDHKPNGPNKNYKDFVRFIMVREEAGTPAAGATEFGVGDTLALNGKVYYWENYEDDLMSNVPVGNFVTLCTGISLGDDLMCTYEIVLGMMTNKNRNGNPVRGFSNSIEGVGAFVANGPNYEGENQMIVTGTEFGLARYNSGTLITTEDLVNPYLYADLYLL